MLLSTGWARAQAPGATEAPTVGRADIAPRGAVLTDSKGMSLYVLVEDELAGNKSTCYADDECTDYWPVVYVEGDPVKPEGIPGVLGVLVRADFTRQLTYNGRPLYYYTDDRKPGELTGDRVTDEWGRWLAVPLANP